MLSQKRTLACIKIFICTILVSFCATAQDSTHSSSEVEARLHKIYVDHYSSPVLDSDWFKIVDSIQEQSYSVKKGDTLWGISQIYFGDGFYWSKLWSVNQNITNPHMISVNDTLNFRSGSFDAAPSLSVESSGADEEASENSSSGEDASANNEPTQPEVIVNNYGGGAQANTIPPFFKNSVNLSAPVLGLVTVEKREKVQFRSLIRLNRDILANAPEFVGKVLAVGTDRMNTGESNKIVIGYEGPDTLASGSVLSILDRNINNNLEKGHWVKALAVVRIVSLVTGTSNQYEADVIEQFDGIMVGSPVSTYRVKTVDLSVAAAPRDLLLQVVKDKTKSLWAEGDIIFLQSTASDPNPGDIVRLNSQFASQTQLTLPNLLIKVVSVNPPFSTGIVMDSRTALISEEIQ